MNISVVWIVSCKEITSGSVPPLTSSLNHIFRFISFNSHLFLSGFELVYGAVWPELEVRLLTVNLCSLSLSQPRLCMATNWQQWEWAANQPRPPVASWRPVRGTRSGSCPAGSEAPRRLARRGSCSCWWRRKSAGWNGRVRCVSVTVLFLCLINVFCSFHADLFKS